MLSPMQCRAARAALSISASELAEASQVHANTISRLEKGGGIRTGNAEALRAVFEARGVIFVEDGMTASDTGEGLRLVDTLSPCDPGDAARSAMDAGITALWSIASRSGRLPTKGGALTSLDAFRIHWVLQPSDDLRRAMLDHIVDADEDERKSIGDALEVMKAVLLKHVRTPA